MSEFIDQSNVTDLEKAKRFLQSLASNEDWKYFYNDGFPRHHNIQKDAAAALRVLKALDNEGVL